MVLQHKVIVTSTRWRPLGSSPWQAVVTVRVWKGLSSALAQADEKGWVLGSRTASLTHGWAVKVSCLPLDRSTVTVAGDSFGKCRAGGIRMARLTTEFLFPLP